MQISHQDIVTAAEMTGLNEGDYAIRSDYKGWNLVPCAGVTLPPAKATAFVACLVLVLAEQGRMDEAQELATGTDTETLGLNFTVYWVGSEMAA